jgi:hypothetical protein
MRSPTEELQNCVKILFPAVTSKMFSSLNCKSLRHFSKKILGKCTFLLCFHEKSLFSTYEKKAILWKSLIKTVREVVQKIFSCIVRCIFISSFQRWKSQFSISFRLNVIQKIPTRLFLEWTLGSTTINFFFLDAAFMIIVNRSCSWSLTNAHV